MRFSRVSEPLTLHRLLNLDFVRLGPNERRVQPPSWEAMRYLSFGRDPIVVISLLAHVADGDYVDYCRPPDSLSATAFMRYDVDESQILHLQSGPLTTEEQLTEFEQRALRVYQATGCIPIQGVTTPLTTIAASVGAETATRNRPGGCGPRIYMAGKIRENDNWREPLLTLNGHSPLRKSPGDTLTEMAENEIDCGGFVYVGPFFIGGDHGMAHGPHSHGLLGGHEPDQCFSNEGFYSPITRVGIARHCLTWIDEADLVFAWIDSPDAYGSLVEIGYARAIGRPVFVAFASEALLRNLWFAAAAASTDDPLDHQSWAPLVFPSAKEAFEQFCKTYRVFRPGAT